MSAMVVVSDACPQAWFRFMCEMGVLATGVTFLYVEALESKLQTVLIG